MPQFEGENYDCWIIAMKALSSSQDTWNLVENGFAKAADAITYNVLTQEKNDLLRDSRKKDSKAFFYIFQAMHEFIFAKISAATKSKRAWDILHTIYQGMEKVKTAKLQMLRRYFETICIESEKINSLFTQFIGLLTQIRSHGETLEEWRDN